MTTQTTVTAPRGIGVVARLSIAAILAYQALLVAVIFIRPELADPVATPLTELTTIGTLHVLCGFSALMLLPFAALLINLDVARGSPTVAAVLRWTAWLPLAGLVLHLALSLVMPPEGWPPRLLFLSYATWLIVLATHIGRFRRARAVAESSG
jgi:hypothetical protein